jgi:hypothetical protein
VIGFINLSHSNLEKNFQLNNNNDNERGKTVTVKNKRITDFCRRGIRKQISNCKEELPVLGEPGLGSRNIKTNVNRGRYLRNKVENSKEITYFA